MTDISLKISPQELAHSSHSMNVLITDMGAQEEVAKSLGAIFDKTATFWARLSRDARDAVKKSQYLLRHLCERSKFSFFYPKLHSLTGVVFSYFNIRKNYFCHLALNCKAHVIRDIALTRRFPF